MIKAANCHSEHPGQEDMISGQELQNEEAKAKM
jgi:hypothetical protein